MGACEKLSLALSREYQSGERRPVTTSLVNVLGPVPGGSNVHGDEEGGPWEGGEHGGVMRSPNLESCGEEVHARSAEDKELVLGVRYLRALQGKVVTGS